MDVQKETRLLIRDILFIARVFFGFLFVVVGVIDLFIPLLPDILFIAFGIILLDARGRIFNKLVKLFPKKYQKVILQKRLIVAQKIDKFFQTERG